jgi:outer membrane immunogenic protein
MESQNNGGHPMRTRLSLAIAAALLAGSITAASAADMAVKARPAPPPPVYDWTGWYLGVGFGGLWGDSRQTFDAVPIAGAAPIPGGTVSPGFDQPMVSFHGGHLHQFSNMGWGSIVIGIDQSAAMPLDNSIGTVACPNAAFNCGTRLQSLFTTGAILGLAWDRVLLSARGGWAGGQVETRRFVAATGALFDNTKLWHNGWYVGGGIDWAVYKTAGTSGILGLEYQYVDLGEDVHCPTGCGVAIPGTARNVDVTANVIKAKFTVKFDGPPLLPF